MGPYGALLERSIRNQFVAQINVRFAAVSPHHKWGGRVIRWNWKWDMTSHMTREIIRPPITCPP
eukprot:3889070-Prymnesium_polylepis.1